MKSNRICADIKNRRGLTLSEQRSAGADFIKEAFELYFFKTMDGNLKFPLLVHPEHIV